MGKIIIPYIEGDGIGGDIWNASRNVFEEAVLKADQGRKQIEWIPLLAGQKSLDRDGVLLSEETLAQIRKQGVALKGPLTTPVGGGFRSINVYLRQVLDLYVCLRPVRYFAGLPSPLKNPERVDLIIFRENTEDLYKGIEWKSGSEEARTVLGFLKEKMQVDLPGDTGLGVKPISRSATQRFARFAFEYAIRNQRKRLTIVHKGNIMKFTEGAFREWAYETAKEYAVSISPEEEKDKIPINDRIADNMFMQAIQKPEEYDVLVCPNLNGDYLSDACAALIGGLGVAPGANIGEQVAIFEPTHGSAPKYADQDVVNPASFLLSGALLFRHIGDNQVARLIEEAVEQTVRDGIVTYDLARQMKGVSPVKCSVFGEQVAKRIRKE